MREASCSLSAPRGEEGRGEAGVVDAKRAVAHLTLRFCGPFPLPPEGRRGERG
jgi:hypothetical protein